MYILFNDMDYNKLEFKNVNQVQLYVKEFILFFLFESNLVTSVVS